MSDDTTWFWQIVDARGLADVSSDEFTALNELISRAERYDEALSALREKEERVKALEECVKSGLRAERASYLQALAEQQGHDAIAGRHDKTVTEWRAHARSVLSSVQPVSGSREQRGNEEG